MIKLDLSGANRRQRAARLPKPAPRQIRRDPHASRWDREVLGKSWEEKRQTLVKMQQCDFLLWNSSEKTNHVSGC